MCQTQMKLLLLLLIFFFSLYSAEDVSEISSTVSIIPTEQLNSSTSILEYFDRATVKTNTFNDSNYYYYGAEECDDSDIKQIDISENPYTWNIGENSQIEVTVPEGYSIAVTIKEIDLNGDIQDYILLKTGESIKDGTTAGKIFTYKLNKEVKYVFKDRQVFGYRHICDKSDKRKFTIIFEKLESAPTTTTEPTTTTTLWPTAAPSDKTELTVYIDGFDRRKKDDEEFIDDFKEDVAQMAIQYCSDERVEFEQITKKNVLISSAKRCPYNWPKSEKCVEITFKLPVIYESSTAPSDWHGYQLKEDKLQEMWDRYSKKYLAPEFKNYETPDVDEVVTWWAIALGVVIVAFIVILIAAKFLSIKCSRLIRKRRASDTFSIISQKRTSQISLGPHYLQVTPKFFENEYPLDPEQ